MNGCVYCGATDLSLGRTMSSALHINRCVPLTPTTRFFFPPFFFYTQVILEVKSELNSTVKKNQRFIICTDRARTLRFRRRCPKSQLDFLC